jgi:3-hydroxyisobutyryl-CoA hydrolase
MQLTNKLLRKPLRFKFSESTLPKVIFNYKKNTCLLTLNNPKAFNALDEEMLLIIKDELSSWESQNAFPTNLILKSDHPKAFCAGGDIVTLLHMRNNNAPDHEMFSFFKTEFEVDYKLSQLTEKGMNTFAFWDGIIMGGGVGISSGCKHRIATEKTLYAMPETRIGLFVDVALSYYLTKLGNDQGRYLALLGHRLKGSQVYSAGLANSFVPHAQIGDLENMIINEDSTVVMDYLSKEGQYKLSETSEIVDYLGFNCLVRGVMDRMGDDTSKIISSHEEFLKDVQSDSLDLKGILKGFAFSENLSEGSL